ncbi:hypothetical protein KCP77_03070 [Salmonella enterica subsp. enterica]|nr:hypothetical protein KCP77_03070 [Salmonella enterica subsp. enterica]
MLGESAVKGQCRLLAVNSAGRRGQANNQRAERFYQQARAVDNTDSPRAGAGDVAMARERYYLRRALLSADAAYG